MAIYGSEPPTDAAFRNALGPLNPDGKGPRNVTPAPPTDAAFRNALGPLNPNRKEA